jgi:hypothetical protein
VLLVIVSLAWKTRQEAAGRAQTPGAASIAPGKSAIHCAHCGAVTQYHQGAAPPLICPHCRQALQPMPAPAAQPSGANPPQVWAQPVPPASQAQPAARPSRLRFGLMSAMFLLVGLCFAVFAVSAYSDNLERYQRLASQGQVVSATITNLQDLSNDHGESYRVQYTFPAVLNGTQTTISSQQFISREFFFSLQPGQAIAVIYDVSDPKTASIQALNAPPNALVPLLIIGLMLVGSAILIYADYRSQFASSRAKQTSRAPGISTMLL